MTRRDLQNLARARLADARILIRSQRFDGGYYLLGLAVECALKACIARLTRRFDFPDKDVVGQSYTHQFASLVRVAKLEATLEADIRANPQFGANWLTVKDWTIESRYAVGGPAKARALYAAVTHRRFGVMRWIRRHW